MRMALENASCPGRKFILGLLSEYLCQGLFDHYQNHKLSKNASEKGHPLKIFGLLSQVNCFYGFLGSIC
jgi:hypothetical protein